MTATFTCPRRIEDGMADTLFAGGGPDLDSFVHNSGLIGQTRGCSYCGSMTPEDFLKAVKSGLVIGPTDKSYKLYVDSHKGKFYTLHLSEEQGWEFDELVRADKVNWGYPGSPYVALRIPGPSTNPIP